MSLNVMKEYIKFEKKFLFKYAMVSLDNFFDRKIFTFLLDNYIDIRYYDTNEIMGKKQVSRNINRYLELKFNELDEFNEDIRQIFNFFGIIYRVDGAIRSSDLQDIVDKTCQFRREKLSLMEDREQVLLELLKERKSRLELFLNKFNDSNFSLKFKRTDFKKCFNVILDYNIKIPKLYSEYAIEQVFDTGIVGENKLFVLYYMVACRVLKDIIELKYDYNYLIDFKLSLFEKEDKIKRLIGIIDDDILRDRIILKITYNEYKEEKSKIDILINKGFRFALIIDDYFDDNIMSSTFLDLFSCILVVNNEEKFDFGERSNVINSW